MYRGRRDRTGWDDVAGDLAPILTVGRFLLAFLWLVRLFVDNRKWSRIFSMQNQVHTKLI